MKQKITSALSLALIVAMLFTSVALADNLVDNVTVGGNDTINQGSSTTIGYKINANGGDGQTGCNANDGSPATVTLSVPAGVSATSSDPTWNAGSKSLTFSTCGDFKNVTFGSNTPGDYAINVSNITDLGAGAYSNQANFTLHVLSTVQSQTITVTTPAPASAAYGSSFGVAATASSGLAVAITTSGACSGSGSDSATVTMTTGTGSCTVNYNQVGNGSYSAAPLVSSSTTAQKANANITVNGYAVTYDGAPHTATGSALGVSNVSLSGLDLSGTTHTAAGSYTDSWSFAGDGNYNSANGTVSDSIGKAPATVTLGTLSFTYDGSAKATTATTSPAGLSVDITYDGSPTAPTNAGSYAVSATINNANYEGSATGTLTIDKANANCSISGFAGVYNGAAHGATGTCTGVGGVDLSGQLDLGATFTNAPGGNAHWTFTGATNYNDQSGDAAIDISKADAVCTITGYTGTYDGAAHGATGSCKGVGNATLSGLNLDTSFTDVPGGTAHWTFSGGTNYNDQSGNVAIAISKANATLVVDGYTGVYDGASHGATGSAKGVLDESLSGLDLGASFMNVPGGSANWTFTDSTGNYNDASGTVGIVLTKADATINVSGYTGTYDGNAHGASGTATGVGGANLNGQLDLGSTFTDYPGGTAHWTFDGGTNYNDAEDDVAITINKASSTVTVSCPASVVYTGAAQTPCTAKATGVAMSDVSLTVDYTNNTNAGPASANASWAGDNNHTGNTGTGTFTISKADPVCSISGYTGIYDGALHGATGSCSGIGGENAGTLSLGETFKMPPGGTADWTFSGNNNYNDKTGQVSIVINPWTFGGFFQPVDNGGVLNTVKNGSTVPLKFEVYAGSAELTDTAVVKSLMSVQIACVTGTEDAIETVATSTSSSLLRYDAVAGQFIFNWKTPSGSSVINKCYRVTVETQDGSKLFALFKLK
jgi:hypothetical protein